MSKKEELKTILRNAIIKHNTTKIAYHYIITNEEIESIFSNKRITNKQMIRRIRQIERDIDRMEDEIRFLKN
jgi:hypothetical protein